MTFSENCVDSNYRRQGSLDRLSGTEKLKTNRINIMKVYISAKTSQCGTEEVEVKNRFESDNNNASPAHHILRKAERIVLAMKQGGIEARVLILPESANELEKIIKQGIVRMKQVWHFDLISKYVKRSKMMRRYLNKMKATHKR